MIQVRQIEGRSSGKTGWVHPRFKEAIKNELQVVTVPVYRAPSAKEPAREVPACYLKLIS